MALLTVVLATGFLAAVAFAAGFVVAVFATVLAAGFLATAALLTVVFATGFLAAVAFAAGLAAVFLLAAVVLVLFDFVEVAIKKLLPNRFQAA